MTGRGVVKRVRGERGQAMVELVLALPFVLALLFAVVWVGVGFYRYLQVGDAAQAAARAGAVARFAPGAPDPCTAASDRVAALGIGTVTACTDAPPGSDFTVKVNYDYNLEFPFFNQGLGFSVAMSRTVTQRVE